MSGKNFGDIILRCSIALSSIYTWPHRLYESFKKRERKKEGYHNYIDLKNFTPKKIMR